MLHLTIIEYTEGGVISKQYKNKKWLCIKEKG